MCINVFPNVYKYNMCRQCPQRSEKNPATALQVVMPYYRQQILLTTAPSAHPQTIILFI